MQELFNAFLSESISIRDTAVRKDKKENFFIVPPEKTGCVIEVKYAENGAFGAALREAMEQIEAHAYTGLLRQEGMETIHKYGLACYRKTCRVAYEKE